MRERERGEIYVEMLALLNIIDDYDIYHTLSCFFFNTKKIIDFFFCNSLRYNQMTQAAMMKYGDHEQG